MEGTVIARDKEEEAERGLERRRKQRGATGEEEEAEGALERRRKQTTTLDYSTIPRPNPSAALDPVSDTAAHTSITNDSSLLPISLEAIASSIPENSSSTPSIPIGNSPNILTNEFPNTNPSTNFPTASNKTEAPVRPPNLYCPASPPAPTNLSPNLAGVLAMAATCEATSDDGG